MTKKLKNINLHIRVDVCDIYRLERLAHDFDNNTSLSVRTAIKWFYELHSLQKDHPDIYRKIMDIWKS